jgi:hypothetical protein
MLKLTFIAEHSRSKLCFAEGVVRLVVAQDADNESPNFVLGSTTRAEKRAEGMSGSKASILALCRMLGFGGWFRKCRFAGADV